MFFYVKSLLPLVIIFTFGVWKKKIADPASYLYIRNAQVAASSPLNTLTFQLSYLGMGEKRVCLVSDLGSVNLSVLYQVPLFFARLLCVLPTQPLTC